VFQTGQFIRKLTRVLDNPAIEINIVKDIPEVKPTLHDDYFHMVEQAILKIYPNAAVVPILSPSGSDCNYFRYHDIPFISFYLQR
jgi:di/tripeptidase